jgi:hypothetical protein
MKNKDYENEFPEHALFSSWSEASAQKTADELGNEINLYLIAKIWSHAQTWNEKVVSQFKSPISIFVPHQHNPYNTTAQSFKHCVHDIDLEAICKSQGAILLPPYGNDCSYEVGVYKMLNVIYGKGRIVFPVIAVVQEDTALLKDWMVKAGITHVVTDNPKTLKALQSDPMLGSDNRRIIKISKLSELQDIVLDIVYSSRKQEETLTINEVDLLELAAHIRIPLAVPADA